MATSEPPNDHSQWLRPQRLSIGRWWKSGEPLIWLNATAVAVCIVAVLGLLGLIAVKGLAHFWPSDVLTIEYDRGFDQTKVAGEVVQRESISRGRFLEAYPDKSDIEGATVARWMVKSGNRRVNAPDFRWIFEHDILSLEREDEIVVFERAEWGNAYGTLATINETGKPAITESLWDELQARIKRTNQLRRQAEKIQNRFIERINHQFEKLRLQERRRALKGNYDIADLNAQREELNDRYIHQEGRLREVQSEMERDSVEVRIADGRITTIQLSDIIRAWQPNSMSYLEKFGHWTASMWIFLSEDSREANTEGGVFPALFGTVLMVLLMSVMVTPFGVVAALYLREYAKQGPFVQLIRIAVNNLAGVPSIVYGVFGLGFFVYLIGGSIDDLFFKAAQPAPTFGTPGLIWASLTLALLTVPVVIVSTEEGLTRIPAALREGSLALGATKAETMFKVILPMASPSILTGIILAIARAAGEVAPLMLVGVVKLAPTLPIDGNFPFLHLDRKFMHLGFHIYDVGFQSPNVDAARPLVFATALLLVVIIVGLNLSAITLRNRLEARYRGVLL